jgi:hypothetical protein
VLACLPLAVTEASGVWQETTGENKDLKADA